MDNFNCNFCGNKLGAPFLELGEQPLCNNYISPKYLNDPEKVYPLDVYFCPDCYLVQLTHSIPPKEIFQDYAYLSSFSDSWLKHAEIYSKKVIERFNLSSKSFVVEIASNDGYLLKNFLKYSIPVLGIEPATNASSIAKGIGVPTIEKYFNNNLSKDLIGEFGKADLIISNNVYAHVPKINDFTKGIKNILNENGVWTIEFPYLKNLLEQNQFDTIYHEHYYYFSIHAVKNIFCRHGLKIFDIEEIPSHGGSLRIYVTHQNNHKYQINKRIDELIKEEIEYGICEPQIYEQFKIKVNRIKSNLLSTINNAKAQNKKIVGYGAAGKGNTLLNFCGISSEQIDFIVDRNPLKQNKFMPGSRIPIFNPEMIKTVNPDYLLILPWNLRDEIMEANKFIKEWGGKFILPIPEIEILGEAA